MQFTDLIRFVRYAALSKKSVQHILGKVLKRLRYILWDSTKMYLREKGSKDMIFVELFSAFVNTMINL
jgi:hypothetical protein